MFNQAGDVSLALFCVFLDLDTLAYKKNLARIRCHLDLSCLAENPHVRLVLSLYPTVQTSNFCRVKPNAYMWIRYVNVLSMRKFGPAKEKNSCPQCYPVVKRGGSIINFLAYMLQAMCPDDYFTRTSWHFNMNILKHIVYSTSINLLFALTPFLDVILTNAEFRARVLIDFAINLA